MNITFRRVYIFLGTATVLSFFGHAMWAVRAKESFVELVTGSFDHVLGVSVGNGTAEGLVRTIGGVDIGLSIVMAAALFGFIQGRGRLYAFATSPFMLAVWTWAVIWSFATAASRMSGAGLWYPEVWDLVERGPNFLVPAALIVLTLALRRDEQTAVQLPQPLPESYDREPERELALH